MSDDARLLELTWLALLENGERLPDLPDADCPERRLAIYLFEMRFVCNIITSDGHSRYADLMLPASEPWPETASRFQGYQQHWKLTITHRGAVRRAELEQQLKTGRIKEPMGMIWDGRHFRQDARIALLDASPERPLGVVYLDLNDVKEFNALSHATGDAAIQRYLEVVAELSYDRGDAYRLSGGADEVVVLLPRTAEADVIAWTRKLIDALGRESFASITLRVAAGVVVATAPDEAVDALKERADAQQRRAKSYSRRDLTRPSRVAWAGDGEGDSGDGH